MPLEFLEWAFADIILNTINSARALRMGNRLEVKERRC